MPKWGGYKSGYIKDKEKREGDLEGFGEGPPGRPGPRPTQQPRGIRGAWEVRRYEPIFNFL
jgi:hypothetical protein